jgi:hypothetical protein
MEETYFEKKAFLRAHPAGRHPPSQTLWNKPSEETTLFWKSGFSSEPPSLKNRSIRLRIRVISLIQ